MVIIKQVREMSTIMVAGLKSTLIVKFSSPSQIHAKFSHPTLKHLTHFHDPIAWFWCSIDIHI